MFWGLGLVVGFWGDGLRMFEWNLAFGGVGWVENSNLESAEWTKNQSQTTHKPGEVKKVHHFPPLFFTQKTRWRSSFTPSAPLCVSSSANKVRVWSLGTTVWRWLAASCVGMFWLGSL